jgi:hypothetical protein
MRYFVVLGTLKAKLPLYKKMESKYEKMEVVIFHPAAFSNRICCFNIVGLKPG